MNEQEEAAAAAAAREPILRKSLATFAIACSLNGVIVRGTGVGLQTDDFFSIINVLEKLIAEGEDMRDVSHVSDELIEQMLLARQDVKRAAPQRGRTDN